MDHHPVPTPTHRRRLVLAVLLLLAGLLAGALVLTPSPSPADEDRAVGSHLAVPSPGGDETTTTTTAGAATTTTAATPATAAGADHEAESADPEASDDDDFPGLPEDDDDPGPWFPPSHGIDDFAPTPKVLGLVAKPPKPQLGEGGSQQAGGGFSTGVVQCDGSCIEWATVEPHGTSATFRMHTTVPARLWVSMDAPAVQDTGSRVRDWEVTFEDLTPDTLYNVVLVAEDVHGNLNHRYGQFRTLERRVEIAFTSIDVIDDADHGKYNRGEIAWFFAVGGEWISDFDRGTAKVRSGKAVHLGDGRHLTLQDAGRYLELDVQGVEHDNGYCAAGIPPYADHFGGDIDDCRDVATAHVVLDLDDLVAENQALPGPGGAFHLRTDDHYLKFEAYGTIHVTYV